MSEFRGFTVDEVQRIDRALTEGRAYDTAGLPPELTRILHEARSTTEDVERGSAAAYRVFLRCLEDMRLQQPRTFPIPSGAKLCALQIIPIR